MGVCQKHLQGRTFRRSPETTKGRPEATIRPGHRITYADDLGTQAGPLTSASQPAAGASVPTRWLSPSRSRAPRTPSSSASSPQKRRLDSCTRPVSPFSLSGSSVRDPPSASARSYLPPLATSGQGLCTRARAPLPVQTYITSSPTRFLSRVTGTGARLLTRPRPQRECRPRSPSPLPATAAPCAALALELGEVGGELGDALQPGRAFRDVPRATASPPSSRRQLFSTESRSRLLSPRR